MSDWKTLEGSHVENIYEEIRKEVMMNDEVGGMTFAYIGCDGQNIGQKYTSFVQCVALHKFNDTGIGKGGRVYYIRHLEKRYWNRNQRLLREAEISINLAQKLEPLFTELDIPFEVHADVNSDPGKGNKNKSNEVHDMVKGWISSMGFVCKTKPQAFVASIICDRHTRGVKHKRK
jgi:predicted RNase H-related nuclease YkuK (DUF458 family)